MRIYPTKHELDALKRGCLTQLRRPQRLWRGEHPFIGRLLHFVEPFGYVTGDDGQSRWLRYRADATPTELKQIRWKSASAMAEAAARFRCRITAVADETCRRAQATDPAAMGYAGYAAYATDWQDVYGPASWDTREKVWIIDVERIGDSIR